MFKVSILLCSIVSVSAVRSHAYLRSVNNTANSTSVDQCMAVSGFVSCDALIAHAKTDFVVDLKDEKVCCKKINAELQKMENMKIRCEKNIADGNQGGGVHGGSETCWPRLKEHLPKYLEHLKKLHKENKCPPPEEPEIETSGYGF
eukprot:gnl/MRDRNA2_/MRDRNA2_97617_c0_seq1.p1 gnl/MRDRNA2_/MRDRNA2_97617_c0~~gnl/MRDRNA2_/MRDRNA2_97617_c0_seq1.p1  ORF type:complete len:146 (+),score=34.80 gnl/MRDRNA2_/MRDRNA2_97617_c0_seq1:94-531(+)